MDMAIRLLRFDTRAQHGTYFGSLVSVDFLLGTAASDEGLVAVAALIFWRGGNGKYEQAVRTQRSAWAHAAETSSMLARGGGFRSSKLRVATVLARAPTVT